MYSPVKIQITPEMLMFATARDCGQMNSKSFMKGKGNIAGFLGEEMLKSYLPNLLLIDSYDYDFLYLDKYKIDVKTKFQSVNWAPKGTYEASVAKESLHQRCDYYVFCRIYRDPQISYPHGWILGFMSKKRYLERANFLKKDDFNPSNKYYVKEDCWNLPYEQLFPIEELRKIAIKDKK